MVDNGVIGVGLLNRADLLAKWLSCIDPQLQALAFVNMVGAHHCWRAQLPLWDELSESAKDNAASLIEQAGLWQLNEYCNSGNICANSWTWKEWSQWSSETFFKGENFYHTL